MSERIFTGKAFFVVIKNKNGVAHRDQSAGSKDIHSVYYRVGNLALMIVGRIESVYKKYRACYDEQDEEYRGAEPA